MSVASSQLNGPIRNLSSLKMSSCWQVTEWYLDITKKGYKVVGIDGKTLKLEDYSKKHNCFATALKVFTYITILLPVIALVVRQCYRKKHTYNLNSNPIKSNKLEKTDPEKCKEDLYKLYDDLLVLSAQNLDSKPHWKTDGEKVIKRFNEICAQASKQPGDLDDELISKLDDTAKFLIHYILTRIYNEFPKIPTENIDQRNALELLEGHWKNYHEIIEHDLKILKGMENINDENALFEQFSKLKFEHPISESYLSDQVLHQKDSVAAINFGKTLAPIAKKFADILFITHPTKEQAPAQFLGKSPTPAMRFVGVAWALKFRIKLD